MTRSPLRQLLSLAWPMVLARSTQSVIGLSDALLCAPLGSKALAAVGTGALNIYATAMLPMGTVFIVQSFAAQLEGRGERAAARRYAWYGLILAAAAGVLALLSMPLVGPALGLFGYDPEVRRLQTGYLVIRLTAVGAIVGTEALGNWFGGLGNTRPQMIAGATAMLANIALNWVFIYGHLGAPAMGVAGSALASALASWLGFAYLVFLFWRGRTPGRLALRARELRRVIRFGLPNGFNWFLEFAAFNFYINVVVARLGTTALAAMNSVLQINSVSFMPAFGVASAGAILDGQAVGAGRHDDVPRLVRLTALVAISWMGAAGLLYLAAPRALMSFFVSPADPAAPALLATGTTMLALSVGWQLFDGLSMALSEALRSTGDTAWCLRARLVLAWGVFAPGAYLWVVRGDGGVVAAMVCLIGYLALLGAALFWRFRSGKWRNIELVEPSVAD